MTKRVVVWGAGNVGRPAIRAVASHHGLELVGVIVRDLAKVGVDAGELAQTAPLGVRASTDTSLAEADDVDARDVVPRGRDARARRRVFGKDAGTDRAVGGPGRVF